MPTKPKIKEPIGWKNDRRKVKDLVPADYNPRQMTKAQADELKKSLDNFGLADPIILNTDGTIIGGHQRITILADAGVAECDVRVPNRLLSKGPKGEERELNLRLNKNRGEFDLDKLLEFDSDLLKDVGFDSKEMNAILGHSETSEDDFDLKKELENKKPAKIKPGEIWQLGRHRLMCGDSTKRACVDKLMGGGVADMVFTDPPYGVKYVGKTKEALTIENDAMDEKGTADLWIAAYAEARNVLKDGGAVYATVPAGPLHLVFAQAMKDFGDLRQVLAWVKDQFVMGRSDYHYRHEPILYGWKSTGKHSFLGGRDKDTVWEIERPKRSEEHPTMKPIELSARAIENSCPINGSVLDIFGGAGSTLLACEQTDRSCFMMELDPRYCDAVVKRWEMLTGEKAELLN